jgi:predicted ester cyclase
MSTAVQPNQVTAPAGSGVAESEAERNTALLRRFIEEGFTKGNLAVVDEIIAPDYKEHQYVAPNHPDGPEGVKRLIQDCRRLISGFHLTIQDLVADGDTVWVRMIGQGTHGGEFMGRPPTGKEVAVAVIDICRFEDGKMVEHWGVPDRFHLMVQLGFVPMPPGARA